MKGRGGGSAFWRIELDSNPLTWAGVQLPTVCFRFCVGKWPVKSGQNSDRETVIRDDSGKDVYLYSKGVINQQRWYSEHIHSRSCEMCGIAQWFPMCRWKGYQLFARCSKTQQNCHVIAAFAGHVGLMYAWLNKTKEDCILCHFLNNKDIKTKHFPCPL